MNFLSSFYAHFLQHSEFWSAISGAVIGGLIAYFIQLKALRESRSIRQDDLRQTQQALGNSIIFKLTRIISDAKQIELHFSNCKPENTASSISEMEPWQAVIPLANLPPQINFAPEELAFLISLEEYEVFNSVCILDQSHSALIEAVGVYATQREILMEKAKPKASKRNLGTYEFEKEEYLAIRPNMVAVNSIAEQNFSYARRLFGETRIGLEGIHKLLKEKFDLQYNLEIASEPEAQRMRVNSTNT